MRGKRMGERKTGNRGKVAKEGIRRRKQEEINGRQ